MKPHKGMRPQDIVILIKILIFNNNDWQYRDLSSKLQISLSEVSESLQRSATAGLVIGSREVMRSSFMGFLEFGLPFVFPEAPGGLARGMPTAHSHVYYQGHFSGDINYVWPGEGGLVSGLAVTPLHRGVPQASQSDPMLYLSLSSVDILRVGKAKEVKSALKQLKSLVLEE